MLTEQALRFGSALPNLVTVAMAVLVLLGAALVEFGIRRRMAILVIAGVLCMGYLGGVTLSRAGAFHYVGTAASR